MREITYKMRPSESIKNTYVCSLSFGDPRFKLNILCVQCGWHLEARKQYKGYALEGGR